MTRKAIVKPTSADKIAAAAAAAVATALDLRLKQVETAVIQINHFTESMEKLDLPAWKSEVSADLRWLKWFLGGTSLAALGQLVVSLIRGG